MKYLIFLLSVIYITAISSCKTDLNSQDDAAEPHIHAEDAVDVIDDHSHEGEDHTIMKIEKQKFRFTHKTSGQILVDKKDEIIITASTTGILRFFDHFLFPGVEIRSGQQMFGIYGGGLTEGNASINYTNARSEFEAAEANYKRASQLISDKLITSEHFLATKMEFEKAQALYNVYSQNLSNDGSVIKAPANCYIQEVFVKEGQKVETGEKLASVIIEHTLILKADVAPADFGILNSVEDAKFITGYSKKVYSTSEMNGTKISFGKSTGANSFYIPIYFMIDHDQELIPGTFAEVWLIGSETEEVITIPNRSLLEEYGKYYVFVEHPDGEFEKRYLTLGKTDGEVTHIIAGLHESESIVVDGAYQIKMSQMTSIPNTHDHNH